MQVSVLFACATRWFNASSSGKSKVTAFIATGYDIWFLPLSRLWTGVMSYVMQPDAGNNPVALIEIEMILTGKSLLPKSLQCLQTVRKNTARRHLS